MSDQMPTTITRVIENPVLKDRITFLKTTAETGGEYLLLQVELASGGSIPLHYHTTFTERFEVLDGQLDLTLDGQHHILKVGESMIVSLRAKHRFYNASDKPVTFTTEVRPARIFEQSLRVSYGLAVDGKTTRHGIAKNPSLLGLHFQLAETYLPVIPLWIQKFGGGLLESLGKLLGQDKVLRKYL
jgi:quercetin dioxygenase-like cupin family protein